MIQYSVSESWKAKILNTAERLHETSHDAKFLIYLTNQTIGAKADELKKDIREKFGLVLDIRDRAWFLERTPLSDHRMSAAEQLASEIADPYLKQDPITNQRGTALDSIEARAALGSGLTT